MDLQDLSLRVSHREECESAELSRTLKLLLYQLERALLTDEQNSTLNERISRVKR